MSTFSELQAKLKALQGRKVVLLHLVNMLEADFVFTPKVPAAKPNRVLLDEDKLPIQVDTFDEVIKRMLEEVEEINVSIKEILEAPLNQTEGT